MTLDEMVAESAKVAWLAIQDVLVIIKGLTETCEGKYIGASQAINEIHQAISNRLDSN